MLRNILFICLAGSFLMSCTRSVETSQLVIQLPGASSSSVSQSVSAMSGGTSPWSGTITLSSEINCYAVMVGGPEPDMQASYCKEKTTNNELFRFGTWVGGVPAGGQITLDVPSGPDRTVSLLGFKSMAGGCIDFKPSGPPTGLNSHPRLIATKTINLAPGAAQTSFNVPSSLSALKEIDDCNISNNSGGSGSSSFWSDSRDGDLNVTVPANLVMRTSIYSGISGVTHTPEAGGVATSKKFGFQTRVTNIDTTVGKTLTLVDTPTAADLEPGDKLLWYVFGGRHLTLAPDPNACGGGNLNRGIWGIVKVASVSGTTVVLEDPIPSNPATVNNTNMAAVANEGTSHCLIQVSRVSEFGTVTLNGNLDILNAGLNVTNGQGGLTAVSIDELDLGIHTLGISMTGNGFPSASAGARGLSGSANNTSSAENRPGVDVPNTQSGGGGNAGAGGNSLNSTPGGNAVTYCSGACYGFSDKKMFYGASGGGDGTNTGGNGGGVIVLIVKNITGTTGSINLTANGANAAAGSGGGGAGGSVTFVNKSRASGINVSSFVLGGNAPGNGGGGGGGSIEYAVCTSQQNSAPNGMAFAKGTSTSGSDGVNGSNNLQNMDVTDPSMCI